MLTDLRSEAVKTPDYAESYVRQASRTRLAIVNETPADVLVQYVLRRPTEHNAVRMDVSAATVVIR